MSDVARSYPLSCCCFECLVDDQHESIATIVARLKGGGDDASAAAQELYALTSFTAAVTIDTPAAYTAYDKLVFGGASVPDHHEAVEVLSSHLPSSLCPLKSSLADRFACRASTVLYHPRMTAHFGSRYFLAVLMQSLCCRHVSPLPGNRVGRRQELQDGRRLHDVHGRGSQGRHEEGGCHAFKECDKQSNRDRNGVWRF
jgi:hypothetical protein